MDAGLQHPRQEEGGVHAPFKISPELGTFEEFHQGASDKTILYIQDAHDSLEAQENITKLINKFVSENGVKTVFEEGYEGEVPTDKFFGFINSCAAAQNHISNSQWAWR